MDRQKVAKLIFGILAPADEVATGLVEAALEGKTTQEVLDWLVKADADSLWQQVPDNYRKMIVRYCSQDLDWFSYEFIVRAIAKSNPVAASYILGSPSLQKKVKELVEGIKPKLQGIA
jgi:hypothetical protein